MTDHQTTVRERQHFAFLRRLAQSAGPIKHEGKIVGKWQTVAAECQVAHDKIMEHLNGR